MYAAVFALSGVAINLCQQQLYYAGAGNEWSMILIFPTFFGCLMGGLGSGAARRELFSSRGKASSTLPPYSKKNNNSAIYKQLIHRMKQFFWLSVFDVASQVLRTTSQNLCGSGMFTVIYAILPAFNGVLSYIFLSRVLNIRQWAAICVVVVGLAFSAESEEGELAGEDKKQNVGIGIVLGILGTLASSVTYLCCEKVFISPDPPKVGATVTTINGINDLILVMPWVFFYSIPNREELIYEPIRQKGTMSFSMVFVLWMALTLSNAAHLNACYALLQITDSVTLTMLQGLRAVMVFAISGALFCTPSSPEQCLSGAKIYCMLQVIFGVILYAKSTPKLSSSKSVSPPQPSNNNNGTTTTTNNDDDAMDESGTKVV